MPIVGIASVLAVTASVALGVVFVVSGVAKVASPAQWRMQSAGLGVPWWLARPLPGVEVALGALLVANVERVVVAAVGGALVAAFSALLVVHLASGRRPPCACFGAWSSRPIGPGHLVRNACFLVLAAVAVVG